MPVVPSLSVRCGNLARSRPAIAHRSLFSITFLGLLAIGMLLVNRAMAAASSQQPLQSSCKAWLGDFASKPNNPAFLRIELEGNNFSARPRQADGNWSTETNALTDVTHDPDLNLSLTHGCVLAGAGALFIKAAKGTAYQATAITGQNFGTYHMGTDSLMLVMQGFQVDGHDLYRVAAKGVSPPPPPPLPKATVGKEAASFACPGKQSSAISQAAFDHLPEDYRKRFLALEPAQQAEVICGQRLNDLLSLDSFADVGLNADRAATLAEAIVLLKAGETPHDEDGQATWWSAARHWLIRNTPLFDTSPPIPLQAEYFATFNEDILPHLPQAPADDTQSVTDVVRYTLEMPEAQALQALNRLQAVGALALPLSDGNVARAALTRALSPQVSPAVFELLWKAAGASQKDAHDLFLTAIENDNATGMDRLLKRGLDPSDPDVLLRARTHPKLYATVQQAVFKRSQASGSKLPPETIDPLVRASLLDGKSIDWSAVEPLLKQGGDLSRSFVTGISDERDSLAYFARSAPDRFLDLLGHGLRVDLPYPVGGDALLTRYLRLDIDWLPEGPRPDLVEAMLKRYNNAGTGKPCTDCTYSPLGIALGNKDPHSVAVVKVLLRYGADPNGLDDRGFPYFTYAIQDDRPDMLEAMQSVKPLNLKLADPNGFSPLAIARCYDASKAADWLRQHGAGLPDQGYATCRQAREDEQKKDKDSEATSH